MLWNTLHEFLENYSFLPVFWTSRNVPIQGAPMYPRSSAGSLGPWTTSSIWNLHLTATLRPQLLVPWHCFQSPPLSRSLNIHCQLRHPAFVISQSVSCKCKATFPQTFSQVSNISSSIVPEVFRPRTHYETFPSSVSPSPSFLFDGPAGCWAFSRGPN